MKKKQSGAWICTVKRKRITSPQSPIHWYKYYAVMIDPLGRIRCKGESTLNEAKAWEDARTFFQNEPEAYDD